MSEGQISECFLSVCVFLRVEGKREAGKTREGERERSWEFRNTIEKWPDRK